jgi:hypothetical protein
MMGEIGETGSMSAESYRQPFCSLTIDRPMTPRPAPSASTVPSKFPLLDIIYKNCSDQPLQLGDVIHGHVHVRLSRCLHVQRMSIAFVGEIEYFDHVHQRMARCQFERQIQELWRLAHVSECGNIMMPN